MTKPLSPAAQAVFDAAVKAQYGSCYTQFGGIAAAAIEAVADQVVSEQGCPIYGLTQRENERQQVRYQLLSIAADLKQ